MWRDRKFSLSPLSLCPRIFVVRPTVVRFTCTHSFVALFLSQEWQQNRMSPLFTWHAEECSTSVSISRRHLHWEQRQHLLFSHETLQQTHLLTADDYDLYALISIMFGMGKRISQSWNCYNFCVSCLCAHSVCQIQIGIWEHQRQQINSTGMGNGHGRLSRAIDRPPAPFQFTLLPLSQSFIFTINGIRKHEIPFASWNDKN